MKDEVTSTQLSNAILKPMQNPLDPSETFLSYFQPSVETAKKIILKRKHEDSDDEEFDDEVNQIILINLYNLINIKKKKKKKLLI